jgi:hypothetical protein
MTGGWLVAYAIVLWGRRRFGALAGGACGEPSMSRSAMPACSPPLIALVIAALATPMPAHGYSISSPDRNEPVTLKLAGGGQIEGRYRGSLGTIPAADYAGRYEAWRRGLGLAAAPALGDSVLVLLRSTTPERGVFRGFVNDALLLGSDRGADRVLPLRTIDAVMRADASAPDSSWTGVRHLWKHAPSLCVVAVQVGDATLAVPPTMVAATVRKHDPGGELGAGLVLGALVGATLAAVWLASAYSHGLI